MNTPSSSSPDAIQRVLDRVRPFLQADGGDLELVGVEDRDVRLRLTGTCAACPQAQMTLHFGVEAALRDQMPGVRVVRVG
jgi:Fe-S cluster biogenesis protein NfuA